MHVVQVRYAQHGGQHDPDEPAFFVRVDGVVPVPARAQGTPERGQREKRIERNLGERRSDPHAAHERRPQAAEDPEPGHRDVAAERVRHQIDLMAERRQRADAMKFAERGAPRLEERLGCDHQNAHGRVIFARNPAPASGSGRRCSRRSPSALIPDARELAVRIRWIVRSIRGIRQRGTRCGHVVDPDPLVHPQHLVGEGRKRCHGRACRPCC